MKRTSGGCPCDNCRFKSMNYIRGSECPNFEFFFDAFMLANEGVLKTDVCDKWVKE